MEIKERVIDEVVILDLSGKIRLGEGDVQLRHRLTELLGQGQRRMILNLGEVTYVDSGGLGELVRCYTAARRAGGDLKLSNPTKRLVDLFTITKLNAVFETYDTEQEALESFGQ